MTQTPEVSKSHQTGAPSSSAGLISSSKLTFRQQEVFDLLVAYINQHGYPPTLSELADTVARQINPYIKKPIPETMRGALYSFAYNVGAGNFQTSTLLHKINKGDQKGACDQLRRWTYAKGKQWKGLITRREVEREVCLWEQR